jgi:hypothetical protein
LDEARQESGARAEGIYGLSIFQKLDSSNQIRDFRFAKSPTPCVYHFKPNSNAGIQRDVSWQHVVWNKHEARQRVSCSAKSMLTFAPAKFALGSAVKNMSSVGRSA